MLPVLLLKYKRLSIVATWSSSSRMLLSHCDYLIFFVAVGWSSGFLLMSRVNKHDGHYSNPQPYGVRSLVLLGSTEFLPSICHRSNILSFEVRLLAYMSFLPVFLVGKVATWISWLIIYICVITFTRTMLNTFEFNSWNYGLNLKIFFMAKEVQS
jgi:hypothetical protein